jgi:hypothetical protein
MGVSSVRDFRGQMVLFVAGAAFRYNGQDHADPAVQGGGVSEKIERFHQILQHPDFLHEEYLSPAHVFYPLVSTTALITGCWLSHNFPPIPGLIDRAYTYMQSNRAALAGNEPFRLLTEEYLSAAAMEILTRLPPEALEAAIERIPKALFRGG